MVLGVVAANPRDRAAGCRAARPRAHPRLSSPRGSAAFQVAFSAPTKQLRSS